MPALTKALRAGLALLGGAAHLNEVVLRENRKGRGGSSTSPLTATWRAAAKMK